MSLQDHAPGMLAENTSWSVEWRADHVKLVHPTEDALSLQPGQCIRIEAADITLLDLRKPPIALLSGMDGLTWQLYLQSYQVGRRGKRLNHIELNEATVSRQHATLVPTKSEGFNLLCESSAATSVNDKTLAAGEQCRLQHGDLVRFGDLMFRYVNHSEEAEQNLLFGLKTLGTFELYLNGSLCREVISSAKTRWLVGLLGTYWGKPVGVEQILGLFWPEATTSRARKNLGVALKQIRECLELSDEQFATLLNRTRSQLNLNPSCLGSHDYTEVKNMVKGGRALTSPAQLDRLINLYQGPFLLDCYEEWALTERESLNLEVVQSLSATIGKIGELSSAKKAMSQVEHLAPTHQQAVEGFMELALELAEPREAVAAYESLGSRLKEHDLEPEISVVKLFHRARIGL